MLVRRKTETSLPCKTVYNLRWEAGGVPILSLRQAPGGSRCSLNSWEEDRPPDNIPLPSVAERWDKGFEMIRAFPFAQIVFKGQDRIGIVSCLYPYKRVNSFQYNVTNKLSKLNTGGHACVH